MVTDNAEILGNAEVADEAFVGGQAIVDDNAYIGGVATVEGNAHICEGATVVDSALITDSAVIAGTAVIDDFAIIHGNAMVTGHTHVSGNTRLCEQADVTKQSDLDNIPALNKVYKPISNFDLLTTLSKELGEDALRFNEGKTDYTLIPVEAQRQEAAVWKLGTEKYGKDNWKKLWGDESIHVIMASLMRHANAILEGELFDSESELPHAAHIRCNAAMILEYMKRLQEAETKIIEYPRDSEVVDMSEEITKSFDESFDELSEDDHFMEISIPEERPFMGDGVIIHWQTITILASDLEAFKEQYPNLRIVKDVVTHDEDEISEVLTDEFFPDEDFFYDMTIRLETDEEAEERRKKEGLH